jgi:hypothetical protein
MIIPGQCVCDAFFQSGEFLGVRRWGLVIVPHMGMNDGGPGLECLMCGLHLFGDGDRHCRIVGLARQRPGDGNADDAGFCHLGLVMQGQRMKS